MAEPPFAKEGEEVAKGSIVARISGPCPKSSSARDPQSS